MEASDQMKIALIGLGAIGVPIAHKLQEKYKEDFLLIADAARKSKLREKNIHINGELFTPTIVSEDDQSEIGVVNLLIICVKNYGLNGILRNICPFVGSETVILPLQNGVYSHDFFEKHFPGNIILSGYVQGPNTEVTKEGFQYQNSGELHIGSVKNPSVAKRVVELLKGATIPATYEEDILKMVWKKWMLNVAGNSITALTGADYSLFKLYSDLQTVCRMAMKEFIKIAAAEGVSLSESDIDDIIQYYVSYVGGKKTSMLMDVINERKTENDYLAGSALQLAKKHCIEVPIISTLYYLMEVKEEVYMERKGCRATDLYTEGVEYSDALRVQMNDLDRKMKSKEYAEQITRGEIPEQLIKLLHYATANSDFYSSKAGFLSLQDFPVMNRERLNELYDEIAVHAFDKIKTHKMYTSGSTGVPFTVVQDLAKRERNIADLKYYGSLAGYSDHDSMCYLRARPAVSKKQQEEDNIWQLDSSSLSEKNLTDYFHVIVEKKCTALIGYSSTLEIAVDYWSRHFDNETYIQTIISTSEELKSSTREKLRAFFGESVGIHARYSNSEQGILGQEEDICGEYSLNWASYYFEILKMDSDETAADGEIGRIVVTDLYNMAFPMIRYDTGDTGRFMKKPGRLPVLCELKGRQMDIIYDITGEPVSPFLLTRTMRHSKGVKQWQFIQENTSQYAIRIKYSGQEKPNLETEINEFKQTLGCDATIDVEYFDSELHPWEQGTKLIISHVNGKTS